MTVKTVANQMDNRNQLRGIQGVKKKLFLNPWRPIANVHSGSLRCSQRASDGTAVSKEIQLINSQQLHVESTYR